MKKINNMYADPNEGSIATDADATVKKPRTSGGGLEPGK